MPFAGYPSFDACVTDNKDKENPQGYCGAIQAKVEKNTKPDSFIGVLNQALITLKGETGKTYASELAQKLTELKEKKPKAFAHEDILTHLGSAIEALASGNLGEASSHLEEIIVRIDDSTDSGEDLEHYKKGAEANMYAKAQVLDSVEIFKVGTWNGDTYTLKDLDQMVANFESLKEVVKPPVKLGHAENQKLLKEEGLPAAGWVSKLRRVGDTLVATVKDVPRVIADLVKKKAYRRISAEIYPMYKDPAGKTYRQVLRAIAFLGGDIPAVETLRDISALYALDETQQYVSYEMSLPRYKFTVKMPRVGAGSGAVRVLVKGVQEVRR